MLYLFARVVREMGCQKTTGYFRVIIGDSSTIVAECLDLVVAAQARDRKFGHAHGLVYGKIGCTVYVRFNDSQCS